LIGKEPWGGSQKIWGGGGGLMFGGEKGGGPRGL